MDVASYGKGDCFSEKLQKKLGNSKRLKEMELTKCWEKFREKCKSGRITAWNCMCFACNTMVVADVLNSSQK